MLHSVYNRFSEKSIKFASEINISLAEFCQKSHTNRIDYWVNLLILIYYLSNQFKIIIDYNFKLIRLLWFFRSRMVSIRSLTIFSDRPQTSYFLNRYFSKIKKLTNVNVTIYSNLKKYAKNNKHQYRNFLMNLIYLLV